MAEILFLSKYRLTSIQKEIEHITTTPYHPQANGRVEHLNGILLTALRKLA